MTQEFNVEALEKAIEVLEIEDEHFMDTSKPFDFLDWDYHIEMVKAFTAVTEYLKDRASDLKWEQENEENL